ncbi:hypothetical protein BT96DRAFT_1024036 [Gymnopus androsaceus JB14]|uniref:Amino acid transporter transmembrane domain-containing protein n=1 Tax=Gymnopus androsaceus JB14 TaxID=1447944 RepID=A0A6A4H0H0_9AGAR|nr:hypothetical protein BT96DRAFT_1024036 [Gymnopus androsaceus JB14]
MTDIPRPHILISTTSGSSSSSLSDVESQSPPGPRRPHNYSPILSTLDSSSALILVHDDSDNENDDEQSRSPISENSEDDEEEDSSENYLTRPYVHPLSPSTVFLHLFSPYLKLGAILLPANSARMPLKLTLPALLVFAVLAAFARQIWYMLSRYLRKGDLEDVLVDALAFSKSNSSRSGSRRARREWARGVVRTVVRGVLGVFRVLLASVYLSLGSRLMRKTLSETETETSLLILLLILAIVLYFLIPPFTGGKGLGSKRVVYATWASVVCYVLWFFSVVYVYVHGAGDGDNQDEGMGMGILWQAITIIAFTFTSSSTLTLYTCLKAGTRTRNGTTALTSKSSSKLSRACSPRSFKTLSIISVSLAVCFTFPLLIISNSGAGGQGNETQRNPTPALLQDPDPTDPTTIIHRLTPFIHALSALTLLLGIPSVMATAPPVPPLPERVRRSRVGSSIPISFSKTILWVVVVLLAVIPRKGARVFGDIVIVCALGGTYFVPALVHITTHFFKKPLSIIMPTLPTLNLNMTFSSVLPPVPLPSSSSAEPGPASASVALPSSAEPVPSESGSFPASNGHLSSSASAPAPLPLSQAPPQTLSGPPSSFPASISYTPWSSSPWWSDSSPSGLDSSSDPLLQRKELMLQRAQFGRRVMWDVGVWVLLVPVGGGGVGWGVGRVVGAW